MNKTDILIEKTINDYLINEGFFDWFSKKPEVILTGYSDGYLYGEMKGYEEIPIDFSFQNGKISELVGKVQNKWRSVKIANMPQKNEVVYCGVYDGVNEILQGFDKDFKRVFFKEDNGEFYRAYEEDDEWVYYEDEKINHVYFFDEDSNYQQDDSPIGFSFDDSEIDGEGQDNEEIENDDEIDSEPYTPTEINPQYNNKQNTNTNYHQNDNASNHNNNNNEYRNSILNVNEEYPLTNALIRLVRQRKIRDSKRLRSLMADLQDLGY